MRSKTALRPWAGYAYGLLVALVLGHFLLGLPIQLSDSFGQLLKVTGPWRELLYGEFTQSGFMRPLMWGELKLVYELSGGNYFAWYRGAHVIEVIVLVVMYIALVRPTSRTDLLVLPFGLAVLIGLHTFQGTIREAFPLNHFMAVLLYCFAAVLLVMAPYRWWNDVLGVVLFVIAALTLETGLLVAVILAGGVMVGARGVSRPGALLVVCALAGYFILRFPVFEVGSPDLIERSSGFGFRILDPPELVARFGNNRAGFYAYNVVVSALTVLFSEPTSGVFYLTQRILRGDLTAASLLSPLASLGATLLVALFIWRRRHAWRSWSFERDDRIVLLFLMVLGANAAISFPYTKDVVMSPAGAFYAVAVFVAARHVLVSLPTRVPRNAALALMAAFALLGMTWAIRFSGAYFGLRTGAAVERNEWAYAESTFEEQGIHLPDADRVVLRTLHDDALFVHPAPPPLRPPLRWFFSND